MKAKDLTGKRFGYLKVIGFSHKDKNYNRYFKCQCDCGNTKMVFYGSLVKGLSKNCGCKTNELREQTNIERYGYSSVFADEEKKKEIKTTISKKYGVDHQMRSEIVKDKHRKTCMKKYGVENVLQNEEIKQKVKNTCLEKYGVEYALQSNEIKKQIKATNKRKYNVNAPAQNKKIRAKQLKTCKEKYGDKYFFRTKEFRNKSERTCMKKYGVKYGIQSDEIKEKSKKTCLKKYGVDHPSKDPNIALKMARNSNRSIVMRHWKTNGEIICIGSYEVKVIEYLNKNKVNFLWQPKIFITPFKTPTGRNSSYRPDIYLLEDNKWIEIKGYKRPKNMKKWNWFHKEYPKSELWDKNALKRLNIL